MGAIAKHEMFTVFTPQKKQNVAPEGNLWDKDIDLFLFEGTGNGTMVRLTARITPQYYGNCKPCLTQVLGGCDDMYAKPILMATASIDSWSTRLQTLLLSLWPRVRPSKKISKPLDGAVVENTENRAEAIWSILTRLKRVMQIHSDPPALVVSKCYSLAARYGAAQLSWADSSGF